MNRPVQLKITDEELWGEAPVAATFENVQVGYELLVLSYGIGQDSWALLVKWAEDPEFQAKYPAKRFLVISAETGNEHDETYQHLEYTKQYCADHGIEYVHITPDLGYHSPNWQYLHHLWERKNVVGSKAFPKTCTMRIKVEPFYRFLGSWIEKNYGFKVGNKKEFVEFAETYGKIGIMIGFSAGEEKRVAGVSPDRWRRESLQMLYPLFDLDMTRGDCQNYLRSVGQPVPIPSACKMCCWMSPVELLWLHNHYPDDYHKWVEFERRKLEANQHMGDKNLGVWGKKTLPEVLAEAKEKYRDWSEEEISDYRQSHGHCVASRY